MNRNLEPISRKRATPSPHQAARIALKIQRCLGAPHPNHHPSLQQGNPTTLRLSKNTGDLHWRWESSTIPIICMASTNCGRHGARWQSWPNRSCNDRSRLGCPDLWVMVIRRRTEFGWGTRCHIYAVSHHQLGWQSSPAQCQAGKPG